MFDSSNACRYILGIIHNGVAIRNKVHLIPIWSSVRYSILSGNHEMVVSFGFLIMDLITDSNTIMNYTQAIPACIATIKHLLILIVINKKGNF